MDSIDITKRRFEILFSAKLRLKDKMLEAARIQDRIREKSKDWKGSPVIREWRDKRCRDKISKFKVEVKQGKENNCIWKTQQPDSGQLWKGLGFHTLVFHDAGILSHRSISWHHGNGSIEKK